MKSNFILMFVIFILSPGCGVSRDTREILDDIVRNSVFEVRFLLGELFRYRVTASRIRRRQVVD